MKNLVIKNDKRLDSFSEYKKELRWKNYNDNKNLINSAEIDSANTWGTK